MDEKPESKASREPAPLQSTTLVAGAVTVRIFDGGLGLADAARPADGLRLGERG
jgi:hypothetical protein